MAKVAPKDGGGLKYERVAVSSLTPDPRNARRHGDQNLSAVVSSLRRFGQQKPIVIDADGVVLAGNGTLAAARQLGWTHIDVARSSLRGDEARAFAIADNRTAELAEWDLEELQRQTAELSASLKDFTLDDIGFGDGQLGDILASLQTETNPPAAAQNRAGADATGAGDGETNPPPEGYAAQYKIIIDCADEAAQAALVDEFEGRGLTFTAPNVG